MKKIKGILFLLGIIALAVIVIPKEPLQKSIVTANGYEYVLLDSQEPVIYEAGILGDTDSDSVIVWIFGLLTTVFAGAFAVIKKKFSKITAFIKSLYEAIQDIDDAMKDDALSKSEVQEIRKNLKIVIDSFKDIFKKEDK
jgi:hypothetical protein